VALIAVVLTFDELQSGGLREKHAVAAWDLAALFSLHTQYSYLIRHGSHRKHRSQQSCYCCLCIRRRGNVFIKTLPSNGRLFSLYYSGLLWGIHRQQGEVMSHRSFFFKIKGGRL
jgi:hypothetical protein